MAQDWQELTRLTQGQPIVVEKVRLTEKSISIEGQFDLPPLARLAMEDQVFIAAFVQCHGSIKQMEQLFDVSYPTIKNRLNRIGEHLNLVQVKTSSVGNEVLDLLERGEISVQEALERLGKK